MKTLLIITYNWPPDAFVGALRPAKLTKHLVHHGWKPIIVTVKEQYYEKKFLNTKSVDGGPSDPLVIRTRCLPNARCLYLYGKGIIFRLLGREREFKEAVLRGTVENGAEADYQSMARKAKRFLLSLLYTPDKYLGWFPFALAASLRAIKAFQVDCVISTGPPFTSHLIGLAVKKLCNVTWIADFRDPWRDNEQRPSCLNSPLVNDLNGWLESKVMWNADRVVCVTPAMTEFYRRVYPGLPSHKLVTVTNGFDADEFRQLGHVPRDRKFTISYMGIFEYARTPESLLRAVGELVRDGVFQKDNFAIRFIGNCRYADGRSVEEMVFQHGLKNYVEISEMLPRPEALKAMMQAHVLVLFANQQKLQVPAKAYEYIAAGGQILALTEEKGATADVIREVRGSAVVAPEDHESIKQVLATWYLKYRQDHTGEWNEAFLHTNTIKQYEWGELGMRYAAVLGEC